MRPDAVYLDHAATAPLREEVLEAMLPVLRGVSGNPSSLHAAGRAARRALDDARERLAAVLGAAPGEVVFTRGGTEADNLAVLGRAGAAPGAAVVCSAVEHRAVLAAAHAAAGRGSPVVVLPVDGEGVVPLDALRDALSPRPAVVSVLWAGNETGVLQPVEALAAACAEAGVPFHADAVQALGKVPVRVDRVPVTLLTVTAHKLGGPKGTGALVVRRGTELAPLLHGGGQERGLRPGTEDVAGAVGLAVAAERAEAEREGEMSRLGALRDRLARGLVERIEGVRVNGGGAARVATILHVSLPGTEAQMLLAALDRAGIAASSGSACSSGAAMPSHVLRAMGVDEEAARGSLRFSLGRGTTADDVERVVEVLPGIVARAREMAAI